MKEPIFDARIVDCSPESYFDLDGFSQSTAKVMLERSPLHAKAANAKKPTKAMDRGSVVHSLVLGRGKKFVSLDFKDWRTNAAKDARESAAASGMIPMLASDLLEAEAIAASIRKQLAACDVALDGMSEVAMQWHEESKRGPVMCRGMLDHLRLADGVIYDLKISENAATSAFERTAANLGYDIQHAAYTSAVVALNPALVGRVQMYFIVAEPEEPYAVNLLMPDGAFRELGARKWRRAVELWAQCCAENHWPGYGTFNQLTAPLWALNKEEFAS